MVPREELEGYKRSRLPWVLGALALVVVAALLLVPAREKPVPEFELPLLTGGTLSSQDLKGSPIVMNFWASWCAPCREEAPMLEEVFRDYRDEGVRFVGVNIKDSEENARRFMKDYGLTFPVIRDADQELANDLQVYGLPQTFFITEDWQVASATGSDEAGEEQAGGTIVLGAVDERELRRRIEEMLGN